MGGGSRVPRDTFLGCDTRRASFVNIQSFDQLRRSGLIVRRATGRRRYLPFSLQKMGQYVINYPRSGPLPLPPRLRPTTERV